MSLASLVTYDTVTSITPSGSNAVVWALASNDGDRLSIVDSGETDFRLQRSIDFRKIPAKISVNAPNGYTQIRLEIFSRTPKLLANGKITVNTVKTTYAYDVETTAAERTALREQNAMVNIDSNVADAIEKLLIS